MIGGLRGGDAVPGEGRKLIVRNRKAGFEYVLLDRLEAGLSLRGSEVKSLRDGRASIAEAYAAIEDGEVFLHNMDIQPYPMAGPFNHEPKRVRKLLLHRREIDRLFGKTRERGFTLIPTVCYFKRGRAKVELAVAKAKRKWDKREAIQARESKRELRRRMMH
jgi:SsrA-binding protein